MSEAVLERIIREYMQLNFDPAVFIWQGGEPAMAGIGFFEKAISFEKKYGRSGQSVGNAFQTNGTLIDNRWAQLFAEYRFLVGLSIDGPREIHDAWRLTPGGKGTFDLAMNAANILKMKNVAVNILSVVSAANVEKGKQIYKFFRREGFSDLQFIPCLERDASGGVAQFCASPRQYGNFLCEVFDAWLDDGFPNVNLRVFESFIANAAGMPGTLCTFSNRCGSYLVIEHNGEVYPCDFFVAPRWLCGNVNETDIPDLFLKGIKPEFQRLKPKHDPACSDCRWFNLCYCGCVKDWIDSNGKPSTRSYFCEAYKMFFDHADKDINRIAKIISGHKPSPNDPCTCGSGIKYKKCCMGKTISNVSS